MSSSRLGRGILSQISSIIIGSLIMRYFVWIVAILYTFISLVSWSYSENILNLFFSTSSRHRLTLVCLLLSLLGLYDVLQKKHTLLRAYPVIGHLRYIFEIFRPELRQYFFEGEHDYLPFSRAQRSLIYQRAKQQSSEKAFGTLLDVYEPDYEFISHSVKPVPRADPDSFRVLIGNEQCRQPYSASIFNISAMSFGSLSANAIRALNKGARMGNFSHDTGEGSISPYHLEFGGDLVWELGSAYFGCRDGFGQFDPEKFARQAALPNVKMIEIKLSQGAKPGHGGILPKEKITPQIAAVRGIPMTEDCVSPAGHSTFSNPLELMGFIQRLRELSDGKPVGFKLCIGQPWEFMGIVKAMLETGVVPDFIVVDGAEGGTGAAPMEFANHIGAPMREGLLFVHNTLVGVNLRDKIKIGAAGKIVSAFDIIRAFALGADWVNAGRGFMFALGCIQSLSCNTNKCPTGIATQSESRQKALVVPDKAERVFHFHRNTLHALSEMIASAGLSHPDEIEAHHVVRRFSATEIKTYAQTLFFLPPGELLKPEIDSHFYRESWNAASSKTFVRGAASEALPM
ncbi:FMN-binding glutamate synthase family protein [Alkanindiges sp. WGS2144]|uniref:FMN-binding glutamate synthase family protein n=1 Tax=Alkanindiges sp. WGS2144 TaxID=3366808 RepID=UPI0037501E7F